MEVSYKIDAYLASFAICDISYNNSFLCDNISGLFG